jgi:large subunit ribosomal protein L18
MMSKKNVRKSKLLRITRKMRIRKKISGTPKSPRLCVYRSLKHIYAQVIDDTDDNTLVSASTLQPEFFIQNKEDIKRTEQAFLVGEILAKRCRNKNITKVCFDRNGFKYHGRVKALAQGARKGGLNF